MEYIEEALKLEPNSAYYLDSWAWGYYKLGSCEKAKEIMKEVKKLGGTENDEVKNHIDMIDKCIKDKSKNIK